MTPEGRKELVGRPDCPRRAIADGALGIWRAAGEVPAESAQATVSSVGAVRNAARIAQLTRSPGACYSATIRTLHFHPD